MERTDWPSNARLLKLRESGIVPWSSFASACLGAIALLLSAYFLADTTGALSASWSSAWSAESHASGVTALREAAGNRLRLLAVFVAPAGAVLAACLLCGMLQTRFLFRPAQLVPDLSRLNPFAAPGRTGPWGRLGGFFAQTALGLAAGLVAVYVLATGIIGLLNHNQMFYLKYCARQSKALLPVIILILFVLCLLGVLAAQFAFRYAHRMSREEREQEARER